MFHQSMKEGSHFNVKHAPTKGDLKKHVASVHEGKKPFKWEFCGKLFVHEQNLNRKSSYNILSYVLLMKKTISKNFVNTIFFLIRLT